MHRCLCCWRHGFVVAVVIVIVGVVVVVVVVVTVVVVETDVELVFEGVCIRVGEGDGKAVIHKSA